MLNKITNTAANILKGVAGAVASQSNTYNPKQEYRNADKVSQMYSDAINTQYAAGIQNLMDQKKAIPLQYDPQRASVSTNYERGVRNNAEQMANLGLERSGTNLTQQMALETERQRGLAEVNSAQDEATRNLQAQTNEYIAQRDSAIAQQRASTYENAYNNISAYQRQLAQMEKQQQFDKEMAAISHGYNKDMAAISHGYDKDLAAVTHGYDIEMAEITNNYNRQMAVLEYEHSLALANNNYDREAEIKREMAALEQQYKIETLNKQAALDMQLYDKKAATDWGYYQKQANLNSQLARQEYSSKAASEWEYYQKQANLNSQLARQEYNNKAATDWSYATKAAQDPTSNEYKLQTPAAQTFFNDLTKSGWKENQLKDSNFNNTLLAYSVGAELSALLESDIISDTDYAYLIRYFGF